MINLFCFCSVSLFLTAVMVPPSRPNITRLSDEKVMVRWSVPSRESLPIQFFKVQYRSLGETPKATKRSQWMTSNEDIPPNVRMYEVDNLKPNNYYRFRIAAVYSNNDNQLSNVSKNFQLLSGSRLDPTKSHLIAPNLTSVEPISETAVVLHWLFPVKPTTPVDGFYAYYRPASTAGEYYKATVDGMDKRHFKIENLEAGTAYEFKLQSYTSSAASDFLSIITGKTLSEFNDLLEFPFDSILIYFLCTYRTINAKSNRFECHHAEWRWCQSDKTICSTCGWCYRCCIHIAVGIHYAVRVHEAPEEGQSGWYAVD